MLMTLYNLLLCIKFYEEKDKNIYKYLLEMNRWVFLITTAIALLELRACANQSFEPFSSRLVNFTKFFEVEQEVERMKNYSLGIKFNSTREKYMFVFYPLMAKCDEEIQQQYETVMGSFQNAGIGGVAYGLAVSANVAVKVGFWKAGVASLLKTAAFSTISMSALPILISVGTVSYLYSNYKQEELKQICSLAMKQVEKTILEIELKELNLLKSTLYKGLNKNLLHQRIQFMKLFPQIRYNFNRITKRCSDKVIALRKYMKNFIKLGNYK